MLRGNPIQFALADAVQDGHSHKNRPMFCGIQYNHSGRLKLRIDGESYLLDGSWVFLTWPGSEFDYELCGDEPHHYRFICMEPESVKPYVENGLFPIGTPPIRIHRPERFSASMDEAIELIRSGSPERHPRAEWRVEDLLLQLREQETAPFRSPLKDDLEALAEEMERNPEKEFDFKREAIKLSVTLRHFRRVFKLCRGLPPNQFLLQARLNRAGELLLASGEPAGKIARKVGFQNEFYFSALFKRKFHLPPGAYRKEFRFENVEGDAAMFRDAKNESSPGSSKI